ncbi:M48 family metallopeptidase [Lentimicrobium sp. S6]|uniref:M48 family metallopeptidase n=1 Tax=Lentimicrobium sp. S6 TaxID=2735872 RepID=UPI001C131042|nr:M48 family metallopeptidase [Lentimicrobium sp. S6]
MYEDLTWLFLGLLIFGFITEKILEFLNASYYSKAIPDILKDFFSEDNQMKNLNYKKEKFNYSLINSGFSFLLTLVFWFFGGFGWLGAEVNLVFESEILRSLLFFGGIGLFSSLLSLPFTWYYHFVLEDKYGFNKMTQKTFWLDQIKGSLLAIVLGGGIIALVVWVYESVPQDFWWIVWSILSVFMIFMTAFYARLIVPLFNKQTELEEGELKESIEKMAIQLGFQLDHVYVMDGSKRSSKANAYFTGLGKQKRIVLYDTLINDLEVNEIIAVLAHEIGHYKRKHTLSNIILGLAQTGLMLYVLSLFIAPDSAVSLLLNQVVAQDLQLSSSHFYLGLIGFSILYSPISMLLGILMNILSRKFEYQADDFAREHDLGQDLQMSLIKLSKNSLSNLQPHPAYVFVNYSHPPLIDRYQALEKNLL